MTRQTQRAEYEDQEQRKDMQRHVVVFGVAGGAAGRAVVIALAAEQFGSQHRSRNIAPCSRSVVSHVDRCARILRTTTLDGGERFPLFLHLNTL